MTVPLPRLIERTFTSPFRLSPLVRIGGDVDAATELARLLALRTGFDLVTGDTGAIDLRIATGGAPESYTIAANADAIVVTGADAAGLFYGVQTVGQLAESDDDGWFVPAVQVDDAPRFAYRGVMLDVARHFHGPDTVKGYIDRAASLKFNHLHLHLTDDQGWRLEMTSRPLLTEHASATAIGGDAGGFFTREQYRDIVAYAAARHMTVVPEIDLPGHTHAVGLAYPELVEDPVITDAVRDTVRDFGGDLPARGVPYQGLAVGFSSLRIDSEATYDFVADVLGEVAASTPGPFVHIGGDEALGTDPADYATFIERVTEIVAALDKTPVAWHEAGAAAGLHDATIGQYWGFVTPQGDSGEKARAFVRNGSQLILSPADAAYLDMKPRPDYDIGLTWADGPTDLERAYAWEPLDVIAGIDESDVLGVEAALWTETVRDARDVDRLAFPRAAAVAEIAWSPAAGPERTWESFRARVGALAPLWSRFGIAFDRAAEIDGRDAP